jgi:hypothetical protein
MGSECLFIGPESACWTSAGISKKAIRNWTNRDHKKYWESLTGLKQAKGLLQGTSARRTKELLKQKPVMVGHKITYRTVPPERIPS